MFFLILSASLFIPSSAISTFINPILNSGADPWVLKVNSTYFYTHTMVDRIVLYKTHEMSELSKVFPVTVWLPPSSGPYSKNIWAPELHHIDGKFYIYFTADGGDGNHRIWVLENGNADPTIGTWNFKGKVSDLSDNWAIDPNVFQFQNRWYILWSGWGWDNPKHTNQNIYIALLSNPWTVNSTRVKISSPIYDWEMYGSPPDVNEGPEALIGPNGDLFVVYSASGCWTDNYELGLLSLKSSGDPLNPSDWTKSSSPVFVKSPENGAFGPGHNGFFKSLDETEDWLLYHANEKSGQGCKWLRNPRIQKFTWNGDGTPNFGTPVKINTPIQKPSGKHKHRVSNQ